MASEAEKRSEVLDDIQRISKAFWDIDRPRGIASWDELQGIGKAATTARVRSTVTKLLEQDIIRVGRRPETGPKPMEGQTTVDEMLTVGALSTGGGHNYPGRPGHDPDNPGECFTSDCANGCGCWAGSSRSGGPAGVDPFGECPNAPAKEQP